MKTHNHGAQINTEELPITMEQDAWDWITDMAKAARDFVLWTAAIAFVAGVAFALLSAL
jgi:hypothetical protein